MNPPNYAAANYNPTYTQMGAVGRFFRAGINVSFRPKEHVAPIEPVVAPPPPPPAPATQTCPDGSVIEATATCPAPPPPPPPPHRLPSAAKPRTWLKRGKGGVRAALFLSTNGECCG